MIQLLNLYLLGALLLTTGTVVVSWSISRIQAGESSRAHLRVHYRLLIMQAGLMLVLAGFVVTPYLKQVPTTLTSRIVRDPSPTARTFRQIQDIPVPSVLAVSSRTESHFIIIGKMAAVLAVLGLILFLIRELLKLRLIFAQATLYKRCGRVRIYISPNNLIPFSVWLPSRALVVIPYRAIERSSLLRSIAAHELQHHRQHDTRWAYALCFLQSLYFWNPFVRVWANRLGELQEFSCDEALTGRKNFSARDYIQCLVETAENCLRHKSNPACASGFLFGKRHQLQRRIKMMMDHQNKKTRPSRWMVALASLMMASLAFAGRDLITHQSGSYDIQGLGKKLQFTQIAPVEAEVTWEIDSILNHPLRKASFRKGLQRMENFKPVLEKMCDEYAVPYQLLTLALIESGFQNLAHENPERAAGVWQFIASTARNFGLNVTTEQDDRMDVLKASRAAVRYLAFNRARFDSWDLSILSYNAGESAVEDAMKKVNQSKNPWIVKKELSRETQRYYPRLIAGIHLVNHPHLLE